MCHQPKLFHQNCFNIILPQNNLPKRAATGLLLQQLREPSVLKQSEIRLKYLMLRLAACLQRFEITIKLVSTTGKNWRR